MTTLNRRLAGLTAAMGLAVGAATAASAEGRMLMLLSAPETESQAFMLVLANQVQATGMPVSVLLCGAAADAALKSPPEAATKVVTPAGMTVRSLLEGLLKKGGKAEVCAIYLPNRKLAADALMDGVGPAKPQTIAAMMAAADVKVVGQ